MIDIAILGLGQRGTKYGKWVKLFNSRRARVSALCDKNEKRLAYSAKLHDVAADRRFSEAEDFFAAGKLADAIFICSQDLDHYEHAKRAIELGYDIMLEKPVSPDVDECLDIERRAAEKGVSVVVCHVLRYMPFYRKVNELVKSGKYGRIVGINHTENIGYFHFAHSYVRGNWRSEKRTAPMLLAKCCHDFDYIDWLMGGGCRSVSSIGSLEYFKPENAPEGSAERCLDCPREIRRRCPYDAEWAYIKVPLYKATFLRFMWDVVTEDPEATNEEMYSALKSGPYGRCAYKCDNDVCDRQAVLMDYGDGRFAELTATAFSQKSFRRIVVHLERADIFAEDSTEVITVNEFGKGTRRIKILQPQMVHMSGDIALVGSFIDLLEGKALPDVTYISTTVESHRLAALAERSRARGGERIPVER